MIVGSGLGGLECASILSKEGYSVCVLEKNHQIGGNLQTFSRVLYAQLILQHIEYTFIFIFNCCLFVLGILWHE